MLAAQYFILTTGLVLKASILCLLLYTHTSEGSPIPTGGRIVAQVGRKAPGISFAARIGKPKNTGALVRPKRLKESQKPLKQLSRPIQSTRSIKPKTIFKQKLYEQNFHTAGSLFLENAKFQRKSFFNPIRLYEFEAKLKASLNLKHMKDFLLNKFSIIENIMENMSAKNVFELKKAEMPNDLQRLYKTNAQFLSLKDILKPHEENAGFAGVTITDFTSSMIVGSMLQMPSLLFRPGSLVIMLGRVILANMVEYATIKAVKEELINLGIKKFTPAFSLDQLTAYKNLGKNFFILSAIRDLSHRALQFERLVEQAKIQKNKMINEVIGEICEYRRGLEKENFDDLEKTKEYDEQVLKMIDYVLEQLEKYPFQNGQLNLKIFFEETKGIVNKIMEAKISDNESNAVGENSVKLKNQAEEQTSLDEKADSKSAVHKPSRTLKTLKELNHTKGFADLLTDTDTPYRIVSRAALPIKKTEQEPETKTNNDVTRKILFRHAGIVRDIATNTFNYPNPFPITPNPFANTSNPFLITAQA